MQLDLRTFTENLLPRSRAGRLGVDAETKLRRVSRRRNRRASEGGARRGRGNARYSLRYLPLEFEITGIQHPRERGPGCAGSYGCPSSGGGGVVALNNERTPLFVYSGGTQRATGRPLPPPPPPPPRAAARWIILIIQEVAISRGHLFFALEL